MEPRFRAPAGLFLCGFFLWIALIIVDATIPWMATRAPWPQVALCLVAGGLVYVSALSCRAAGGPHYGSIVRAGVLLVMTAVSYWRLGGLATGVLALALLMTGCLILKPVERP